MSNKLLVPAKEVSHEIRVSNSRFIVYVARVNSTQSAREYIEHTKGRYPDATHHVPAYLIGHGASVTAHCSDAGEPAGTAGRPVLAVLQGSGLGDIVMVVIRYFGGTRLGTGGLVRAYSQAAREALEILPLAQKCSSTTIEISLEYSLYERVQKLITQYMGIIMESSFQATVTQVIQVRDIFLEQFEIGLREISGGRIGSRIIKQEPNTIIPMVQD
jgi:uncharacterized YigZ family protein